MSEPSEDELAERIAALEETLEELQDELQPTRGPFGLPAPPTPRQFIRFTDEYAIPAAIAILEANIRTLQLFRAVLRGARGAPREDDVRDRATSIGRTTVDRIDGALTDLQSAIEEANLPRNDEARTLLEDAQSLNREIRDSLADTERPDGDTAGRTESDAGANVERPSGTRAAVDSDGDADEGSTVEIDVDAELASIKEEIDDNDAAGDGADSGSDVDDDQPEDDG